MEEGVNYIGLAKIHLRFQRYEEASGFIDKAVKIFIKSDELVSIGDCYIYKGYIAQQSGGAGGNAEKYYDKAAAIFTDCRNDNKRLRAMRYKGGLLLQKGCVSEALHLYDEVISEIDKLESDYESAKCWFEKYRALKAAGSNAAAESLDRAAAYIKNVDRCLWTDTILKSSSSWYDSPMSKGPLCTIS